MIEPNSLELFSFAKLLKWNSVFFIVTIPGTFQIMAFHARDLVNDLQFVILRVKPSQHFSENSVLSFSIVFPGEIMIMIASQSMLVSRSATLRFLVVPNRVTNVARAS